MIQHKICHLLGLEPQTVLPEVLKEKVHDVQFPKLHNAMKCCEYFLRFSMELPVSFSICFDHLLDQIYCQALS
jgi:hypothetical protein